MIWLQIVQICFLHTEEWLKKGRSLPFAVVLPRVYLLIVAVIALSLVIMTISLFTFQSVLVAFNITTWELMAWDKITYLKHKSKTYGSPFSTQSVLQNWGRFVIPPRSPMFPRVTPCSPVFPPSAHFLLMQNSELYQHLRKIRKVGNIPLVTDWFGGPMVNNCGLLRNRVCTHSWFTCTHS